MSDINFSTPPPPPSLTSFPANLRNIFLDFRWICPTQRLNIFMVKTFTIFWIVKLQIPQDFPKLILLTLWIGFLIITTKDRQA